MNTALKPNPDPIDLTFQISGMTCASCVARVERAIFAATTEIATHGHTELERRVMQEWRWFTRDDMRNCDKLGFALPRVDSIARRLIG